MSKLFFIDNHTHGSYGINFNYANYDEIKYLLREHFKRSIVGICPTLVGESDENIQKQLALFSKIKEEQSESFTQECLILGVHLEGTFLNPSMPGIQDNSTFKKLTPDNFKNLVSKYQNIVKIVTLAPEIDEGLIGYLNSLGVNVQAGHTTGNDLKNCIATTHHFNAMPKIHHRAASITLSGLIRDDIYTEVIADLIHLSKETIKLIYKAKPLNRILLISDSLPCSHFDKNIIFCNKEINSEGKDITGTLAGSNKTLDEICLNLIDRNILTFKEVQQSAFYNQIEYLKLSGKEITRLNYFK